MTTTHDIPLKDRLIIPVYLNENVVLDMLAITEDGFSMVSEVSLSNQNNSEINANTQGKFGSSWLLNNLLKIEGNANFDYKKNNGTSGESKYAKVHTSASLFSKLLTLLKSSNELILPTSDNFDCSSLSTGDFIEAEGTLQMNPLIELLEKTIGALQFSEKIGASSTSSPSTGQRPKNSPKKNSENAATIKLLESVKELLTQSGTIDYILKTQKMTIVLPAQSQYLSNDNISELIGGKFKVIGKVIQVCAQDGESINLLRKTALSAIGDPLLRSFFEEINLITGNSAHSAAKNDINLPIVDYIVQKPAALIIPIAIYA